MNRATARTAIAVALLALAGCATVSQDDPVVADAHAAVYAARNDPRVTTYAPAELQLAVTTLNRVDELVRDAASADEVHRAAYLAQQRAAVAQETARSKAAEAALAAANAERHRVELAERAREAEAARRSAQDAQYQAELSRRQAEAARDQADAARRQAEDAQRRAADAQADAQATHARAQAEAQASAARADALRSQLADLAAQPTDRGIVVTLNDLLFDSGRADLQPGGIRAVRKLADFLRDHPDRSVAIEGFTDSAGSDYANQLLSERRAQAVQLALIDMGVEPARIVVRGYGDAYPIASNATPVGRQMNRRVEVVISDHDTTVPPRG